MRLLRIFQKKPKPPLPEAMVLVSQATRIAYRYKQDRDHIPTLQEIWQMEMLRNQLHAAHWAVASVEREMKSRYGYKESVQNSRTASKVRLSLMQE